MVRKLALFIVMAALAVVAVAQTPAAAPVLTVDQIVAKNIQAHGGMDKMKALKSVRMNGKMTLGPGIEAPMTMEMKRPSNLRVDITIQGMTITQAYDGKSGWMIMPLQGNKDPQPMGEDDVKALAEQADFDGPLVNYKDKGNKVESLGKEAVEGSDAYKLRLTLKDGQIRTIYLDADSFLEIKMESKRMVRGTEQEGETIIGDYKEVEGMMFPFSIDAGAKGSPQRQKITIDKVELNPAVDDARFKMPEVQKAEPAPDKKPGL